MDGCDDVLVCISFFITIRFGQSGGIRTPTVFSVPGRVASHMALTLLNVVRMAGIEPAPRRSKGRTLPLRYTLIINMSLRIREMRPSVYATVQVRLRHNLERKMGIEPTYDFRLLVWKTSALPMDHIRIKLILEVEIRIHL